jgi:hypothetical protein
VGADDRRLLRAMTLVIAAAVLARLFALTFLRPLNPDEVEFFRASDWVRQGLVPFRDFWEHHTPLQWFVFAPFTALASGAGASAVILMRWAQVPLWIGTFWLIDVWMTRAGLTRFARWSAMGAALCSSLFMLPATEFRVDALGCFFFAAGLVALQRMEASKSAALWAGVAFCLAAWANLRLGPLLAVAVVLRAAMRTSERKWGVERRIGLVVLGGIAAAAAALLYFVATGSLADLYRQAWQELYLGNRYGQYYAGAFLIRIAAVFGLHSLKGGFELAALDVGGVLVLVAGTWGAMRALRRVWQPDEFAYVALLQIANVAFIWTMKTIHNYHFLLAVVLAVPLLAALADADAMPRRAVAAAVAVAAIVSGGAALLRGKELDLQYQDFIMREVQRRTPPDAAVWDGVGWALRRRPAYRYWFLPELPRVLEQHGRIAPFDAPQFVDAAPAAVITDVNAALWIHDHPRLRDYLTAHFMPVYRNLWMPGLSAVVTPQHPRAAWLVPADGRYRVIASRKLATHPWFRLSRLDVGTYDRDGAKRLELPLAAIDDSHPEAVRFTADGQPVALDGGRLTLKSGQHLIAESSTAAALLLLPGEDDVLFRQPADGVTLEGAARPVTHVPEFRQLAALYR